jgi:tetratricopeptide (TPR) repeat protein
MKLKDEARRFEQTEDWDRAIELYRRALQEEAGDGELGLYNRIGDLYLRLGEAKSAVEYYVQAADRYAEAGFLNNAIALCNKALRYEPERIPLYEKLGRLCADQGFLTDARRWYLEYAERLAAAGQMDASLGALHEFAELSQDADVWAQLGHQYAAQGRTEDALASFARASEGYAAAGDQDGLERVTDEARAIDASFTAPAVATARAAEAVADEPEPSYDSGGDGVPRADGPAVVPDVAAAPGGYAPEAAAGPEETYEADLVDFGGGTALDDPASDLARGTTDDLTLDEPADVDALGPVEVDPDARSIPDVALGDVRDADEEEYATLSVESLLGDEPGYADVYAPAREEPAGDHVDAAVDEGMAEDDDPLPMLGEDDGPMPMPEWTDVVPSAAPEQGLPSPVVAGEDGDAVLDDLDDLPMLDAEATPDPGSPSVVLEDDEAVPVPVDDALELVDVFDADRAVEEGLAAPTSADITDIPEEFVAPRTPEDRARAMIAEGRVDDALDVLEHAAGAAEEREASHEALRLADLMAELAPRSLRALRLRADVLERSGEVGRLVPALTALAERLAESGNGEAARACWERVLAADPGHAAAREALAPAAAAGSADYVDLAALVGEAAVETTRFVVEEEVPTGDEDQDFHEMLSQFRSKVSEHVSVEDTASHYDLGIAFKEMGLLDEAIAEFQTALRFGAQRLKVYEELGQCFMAKGDYAIAEKLLRQGTNEMATDPSELLGVNYHLGRCYEELERPDDAREAYERVLSLDIDFRDVSERLERL